MKPSPRPSSRTRAHRRAPLRCPRPCHRGTRVRLARLQTAISYQASLNRVRSALGCSSRLQHRSLGEFGSRALSPRMRPPPLPNRRYHPTFTCSSSLRSWVSSSRGVSILRRTRRPRRGQAGGCLHPGNARISYSQGTSRKVVDRRHPAREQAASPLGWDSPQYETGRDPDHDRARSVLKRTAPGSHVRTPLKEGARSADPSHPGASTCSVVSRTGELPVPCSRSTRPDV